LYFGNSPFTLPPAAGLVVMKGEKGRAGQTRGGDITYGPGYWNGILTRELSVRLRAILNPTSFFTTLRGLAGNLVKVLRQRFIFREFPKKDSTIPFSTLNSILFGGETRIPWPLRVANKLSKLGSERAIEVPFALDFYRSHAHGRALEVGDVLGYYSSLPGRLIVDKYEEREGVQNVDILEFRSQQRFDLIISISTIEHVGWDEASRDPTKSVAAIEAMRSLLAINGSLLVTVPLRYNPAIDSYILSHASDFVNCWYYRPVGVRGEWQESSCVEALQTESSICAFELQG
jgi:hypothetical protein